MQIRLRKTGAIALSTIPALLVSLSVAAHEPEKHAEGAQAPDCAAMKDMDSATMDKDDPVMQAMMEQCKGHMESMGHSKPSADSGQRDHGNEKASEGSAHDH
ncbi:MAG: hypothetical protein RIB46_06435 [Pseudomonadales bacterium]